MNIDKILVVDDESIMRNFLIEALKRKGFDVIGLESGEKALHYLREHEVDIVITDMKMSGISGMELLSFVKINSPSTQVIVITAFGTIENAVEAMKAGAFYYLLKPFAIETLLATLEKANQHRALLVENNYLRQEIKASRYTANVIAESPQMKQIFKDCERIAKTNASVFITGETGTGKEVIAHYIHYHSTRANCPFIRVNCAAIPSTLVESEFFGHEKGAFTGASNKRVGRFELADRGTLLLDEVTEVPESLQASLLRVTQELEFERVGGTKPIKVDVRLISTSNRNIQEAVLNRVLREDLFYRLNVVPIYIPPLRERKEDILPLAEAFVTQKCKDNHWERKDLSEDAKKILTSYNWPGNVRELANIIERALVMESGKVIRSESLNLSPCPSQSIEFKTLPELEKQLIINAIREHENKTDAAEKLGISVKALREKLHEYQIETLTPR